MTPERTRPECKWAFTDFPRDPKHYKAKQQDARDLLAELARVEGERDALQAFWRGFCDQSDPDSDMDAWELWESAVAAGLAERVIYDEKLHGEMDAMSGEDAIMLPTALGRRLAASRPTEEPAS